MSSEGDDHRSSSCSSSGDRLDTAVADEVDIQMDALQDKLKRVTKYLHEIQTLSPACEEAQEEHREKQVRNK